MAGIDYNILNQIKGVEVESPMNAMMRAMQLRGLQEASQMNALKMQEYQQQQQESNELAQIIRNPKLKYGSPEFFAEVAARAPRRYADLAAGYEKQKLGEAAEEDRRQKTLKSQFEQRQLKREFGLRKIASANDYQSAVSLIERGIRTGEIDREEADDMLGQLHATGPNTDMAAFRSNVLTNLLPADKALTAASDVEKAQLGVRKERNEVQARELDQALAGFNSVYNPAFISITDKELGKAQVTKRLTAMYEHPTLGAEAKKRMPYEAALKQHLDAYDTDPGNYIAAMMNLSGDKIIEARQKAAEKKEAKDREEYEDYRGQRILAGLEYVDMPTFLASRTARPASAPVEAAAAAPSPDAAAVVPTAAPAPKSVDTSVTVTPSGTSETKALAPVLVEAERAGFDFMDPTAERLYKYATTIKDATKAASVRAIAKEIQDAHVKSLEAKRKEGDFSAEYQDVILARKKVQALKKLQPTPDILEEINDLLDMIKVSKQGKGSKVEVKLPPQEKEFEGRLGKGQAENILDSQKQAKDARDMLETVRIGRGILKSGAITGAGADFFVGLNQALKTAGVDFGYADASANSQAYAANMAQNVGKLIKLFGSGTGLSDADRKYAERMAAGQIALDRVALEKILGYQETAARNVIKRHNQSVKGIKTNIPLEVEIEPENAAPAAPKPPAIGTIKDGYKFKGGNPADKNNWEKVK